MSNPFRKPSDMSGSFLPDDYVAAKGESKANFVAVLLFSLVMFGVVSAFLMTNRRWEAVKSEQRRVEALYADEAQKIEDLKELERSREEMIRRLEITNILVEKVPRSVLLAELSRLAPEGLTFMEIELDSKRINTPAPAQPRTGTRSLTGNKNEAASEPKLRAPKYEYKLSVVGVAESNTQIADFLTSLQALPLLSNVELEYIRSTVEEDVEMRKFKIVAVIPPEADASTLEVVQDQREAGAEQTGDDGAAAQDADAPDQGGEEQGPAVTDATDAGEGG